MTKEEAMREIVSACEQLIEKTNWCKARIEAFLVYYLNGEGTEPDRDAWPDRVLNPKLNGTSALLKRLRDALGCFMPHDLPATCVRALNAFVASGTGFVSALEDFHRLESLNVSYTAESDVFSYMTTQFANMTLEEHQRNLKAKFKAMKNSFFENAKGAFELTNRILSHSHHYHPSPTRMRKLSERFHRLEMAQAPSEAPRHHDVSLAQAATLLARRCQMADLADFAVCERTFRRWEKCGSAPAGYSANCRITLQAFLSWMEGYVVACRTSVAGKSALVRFCDNLHAQKS